MCIANKYGSSSGALHNTAVGDSALRDNTTGSRNTAFGDHTLFNNNGMNNIAIGASAGNNLTTGNNICIDNWESWANPTPFESGTNKR